MVIFIAITSAILILKLINFEIKFSCFSEFLDILLIYIKIKLCFTKCVFLWIKAKMSGVYVFLSLNIKLYNYCSKAIGKYKYFKEK